SITDVSVSTQWTLSFRCSARGILVASCTHTTCSLLAIRDAPLRSAKYRPYLSEPHGSITRGARHGPAVGATPDRPSVGGGPAAGALRSISSSLASPSDAELTDPFPSVLPMVVPTAAVIVNGIGCGAISNRAHARMRRACLWHPGAQPCFTPGMARA